MLVSEVMLQQTPVSRVEPAWHAWMRRWPEPGGLAAAPVAEAITAWRGLGYPRRALWLHRAAGAIVDEHGGRVPADRELLLSLPGVGEYTAAAVLAFAFGERVAVLDTNVRRVLARWRTGSARPAAAAPTADERRRAEALLPGDGRAAVWSVALMELGALVCTARSPRCDVCPLHPRCAWSAAGRPPVAQPVRQPRPFSGSDRQARGVLLRRVTDHGPVAEEALVHAWTDHLAGEPEGARRQAQRALSSLIVDGLLRREDGFVRLPGDLPG